jgi:hypothetical protein
MFSSVFQTGQSGVEILSPSGSLPSTDLLDIDRCPGVSKEYDRGIRGYCFYLERANSLLICPSSSRSSLGIFQSVFCLQLQLSPNASINLELLIRDADGRRRRIIFSSSFRRLEANHLHYQVPWLLLDSSPDGWSTYALDLAGYTEAGFPGSKFASLDAFQLRASLRVRKIFSLPLPQSSKSLSLSVPASFDFPLGAEAPLVIRSPHLDSYLIDSKAEELQVDFYPC